MVRHGCSSLSVARTDLVRAALGWGADLILWSDADHYFPPDALLRLKAHDVDLVGTNYARRFDPTGPTAHALGAGHVWTDEAKAAANRLEEVRTLGFGFLLMKASVLQVIGKPWFSSIVNGDDVATTEDGFFCEKARQAGFNVYLDHALSWQIGHIHETVLWNLDTVADRERWLASRG